jgi:hypothetical protein
MSLTELRGKLRPKDAADYLGLSLSTINKLRCHGGGPSYYKLRRRIAYDVVDLDVWAESRKRASTSEPTPDVG